MVRHFIETVFKDVRTKDKSVFTYFNPAYKNKKVFKVNKEWANSRPGHSSSLFGRDSKSEMRWNNLTEVLFGQMMREFKLKRAYLLMPDKEGNFRSSQRKLLNHFTDLIITKMELREHENAKENSLGKTPAEIERIRMQSEKALAENGKLEAINKLKYDEANKLIEGSFANIMDPSGTTLDVTVDPENSDLILFANKRVGVAFAMDNDPKDLVKLVGRSTEQSIADEGFAVANLPSELEESREDLMEAPRIAQLIPQEQRAEESEFSMPKFMQEERQSQPTQTEKSTTRTQPKFQQRMPKLQKNTVVASTLRGETPMTHSSTVTGIDGQPRQRVQEQNLAKMEKDKAMKSNLTEKEQEVASQSPELAVNQPQKKKKKSSGLLKFAVMTAIGTNLV